MTTKKCKKCDLIKNIEDFGKFYCRDCNREYARSYRKQYYQKNKQQIIDSNNYRNKELYKYKWIKFYNKKHYKIKPPRPSPDKHLNKIRHNIRVRIKDFLNLKGLKKTYKFIEYIGCRPIELKQHLESKFTEGMNWENYGKWHIDHIIPLSSAKTEEEIYKLNHYTNLQPLWARDNLKKGAKCQQ